ncbi:MAG: family 43 glycosylhydrolase [Oscillospiraceae bacterium]|nr:family 43 glycosylhydrolase [Oscillospiraceae bacterium]
MNKEALNPFLPIDVYHPDGEPHVFGDRVYLFSSHDMENGGTYCMLDYEIWSAPVDDLSDWTSRGVNYSAKQDPLCSGKMRYMYAPDCVRGNDGRYYLYYCLSGEKGRGGYSNPISVAVSDTPDGKYEYLGIVRNPDGSPMIRLTNFDPAVINDSGTVRLYFGTGMPWLENVKPALLKAFVLSRIILKPVADCRKDITGSYHVELSDDMLTICSEPIRIDDTISGDDYHGHRFFEGSSIRKVGGRYYFIYSSVNNHELCYATSERPDGGFVYGGTIVSNGDVGYRGRKPADRLNHTGTNHGSIENINGQWYVFHHRQTHNSDYSRQALAERIEILPDGMIPQVEITSCGLNGGPLRGGVYPAVICCNLTNGHMSHGSNVKRKRNEPCVSSGNGERYISGITDGTMIGYKYFALDGSGELRIKARGSGGVFETNLGVSVETVRSDAWTDYSVRYDIEKGTYPLFLTFRGNGKAELKEIGILRDDVRIG